LKKEIEKEEKHNWCGEHVQELVNLCAMIMVCKCYFVQQCLDLNIINTFSCQQPVPNGVLHIFNPNINRPIKLPNFYLFKHEQ
jgi:hypothetical protein